ncbi:MAG: YqaJ viral recombinase family protein [Acetatifactor sp.]|nr:YqaJ viral recombinase family protein [Acetatifactor sp.]
MNVNVFVETEGLSREEWLKYRKRGIGGSDVAAILGISKWKSAVGLWLDKTNQTNEEAEENEAMQWGNIMEPVIRNHFAEVMGKPVVEVKAMLQHPEYPFMLADVDGLTVDDEGNPAILEIKTASEYKRDEWENGIPAYYQTQVQHYLCVTGVAKAYVAVLIGGNSFKMYEVDADAEVQRMLISVEKEFWNKVQNMIRPEIDGSDAAAKLLDHAYRGGISEQIVLPEEAIEYVDLYIKASAEEDNAKAKKQEAANHIKDFMRDYDRAKCLNYTISWKPVSSERLDSKALKENEPEIYQKYVKTSTSRRFTVK